MGGSVVYKAEYDLKYCYTCEKCAGTTDWYESKVSERASNVHVSNRRKFEYKVNRSFEELEETAVN